MSELTAREIQVLDLVASGMTHQEIAERLHVTKHTVKHHTERARAKLGARSAAHAVALFGGYQVGGVR